MRSRLNSIRIAGGMLAVVAAAILVLGTPGLSAMPAQASANPTWTPAVQISGPGAAGFGQDQAVNASGLIVTTFAQEITGQLPGTFGVYTTVSNGGATWSTPQLLSDISTQSTTAAIAVNSEGLFVLLYGQPTQLLSRTSIDGINWTTPIAVGPAGLNTYEAVLDVSNDGAFIATWHTYDPISGNGDLLTAWSTDGVVWNGVQNLEPAHSAGASTLSVSSNGLFAMAIETNNTVVVTTSSDGKTWTSPSIAFPVILYGVTELQSAINADGHIYLQLMDAFTDPATLWAVESNNGFTWSAPHAVSTNALIESTAVAVLASGEFLTAFTDIGAPNLQVWTSITTDGVNFTSPVAVGAVESNQEPALFSNGGATYLLWHQWGSVDVANIATSVDGIHWSSPTIVGTLQENFGILYASFAATPDGLISANWQECSTECSVFASTLDGRVEPAALPSTGVEAASVSAAWLSAISLLALGAALLIVRLQPPPE